MIHGKAEDLDKVIARCIELKMIPMVELHDVTGDTITNNLLKTVNYYLQEDIKQILIKHKKQPGI